MIELFIRPHLAVHWIGIDTKTKEAWIFPAKPNGWAEKIPYTGFLDSLTEVSPICKGLVGIPEDQR